MPKVKANGLEFFYQRMGGDGPTVVFVHGLVIDNLSSWWYTVANAAAAQGADALCYDLRGHGMSDRPPSGYGNTENLGDLLGILDELGIDHPVHVVGNSYGGVMGVALAIARPERVASLVLVEAHAVVESFKSFEHKRLAHGLDLGGMFLTDSEVEEWLATMGGRKLNRMADHAKELILDTTLIEDLRQSSHFTEDEVVAISCPVLLIYGEHSDIFERGALLRDLIPGAQLHVVHDMDHSVLMGSTHEVRQVILDWIAGGWSAPASPASPGARGH